MNNIYDLGYLEIKTLEILLDLVKALDAVVVDVRYSPNSRDPQWRKKALIEKLGDRYLHLKELGNRNYKNGPIEIVDLQAGISILMQLFQSNNVIIMCACWDRSTCHRAIITDTLRSKLNQESIRLSRKKVHEIISEEKTGGIINNQMPLF